MSEAPIGYTVEFEIDEGQADRFERTASQITRLARKTEPGTTMYEFFVSPDAGEARTCEWFEGQAEAVEHLTGRALGTLLPDLLAISEITNVEVYGTPGEELAEILGDFPVGGTFRHLGGFRR